MMFNCDPSSGNDQEHDKQVLDRLGKEIRDLADNSVCSNQYTCKYIGMGSKPCGGYRSYLIYSTSIDEDALISKVKKYNALEQKYNEDYGIISDCSIVMPPEKLICKNGKCSAVSP